MRVRQPPQRDQASIMVQQAIPIDLVREIRSAYLEAPGLRLRPPAAQRRWSVSAPICRAALRVLVDTGFLRRASDGSYVRRAGLAGSSRTGSMPSRDAPWDCGWAEPMAAVSSPWLGGWQMQWTCLKEGGPKVLSARDCVSCARWEPLLVASPR